MDFRAFEQGFNPYFAQINQLSQLANSSDAIVKKRFNQYAYQKAVLAIQLKVDSFIQSENLHT